MFKQSAYRKAMFYAFLAAAEDGEKE